MTDYSSNTFLTTAKTMMERIHTTTPLANSTPAAVEPASTMCQIQPEGCESSDEADAHHFDVPGRFRMRDGLERGKISGIGEGT